MLKFISATAIFLFLNTTLLLAQETVLVKGKMTSTNSEPLPFANIHLENTSLGTTTNEEGVYSLKIPKGKHRLIFQYIGYKTKFVEIDAYQDISNLNIQLESESIELKEIVFKANGEDPAYEIIRNAQAKRKEYLDEVESYRCNSYLKGLNVLEKAPKQILGQVITVDTGIVYFSEAVSTLSFTQPDKYKEEMISSKVSGDSRGFSFNQASDAMKFNLYESLIADRNFTERALVSPIGNEAMLYYEYKLEGFFKEENMLVNKIKVIPRRTGSPAFAGYIYIIEDSWRIHSADLYLKRDAVEFVDSLNISQTYRPIDAEKKIWMPVTQKFYFVFRAFGFEGNGYFLCITSDYSIEPEFEKKFFNNEVLAVLADANKKDSLYWKATRPIPLTDLEIMDYKVKDSLQVIKEGKPYMDSVDRKSNRLSPGILYAGYSYQNSYKKYSLNFQSLLNTIQFNSVEGWVSDFSIDFRKEFENKKSFDLKSTVRYGFSNEQWQGKGLFSYNFNPKRFSQFTLEGGQYVEQLSRRSSISPLGNSIYTLFNEDNFLKIYQKTFAKATLRHEITNGLLFFTSLEYAQRDPMRNTTDFTYRDIAEKSYTPNFPINSETSDTSFSRHNAYTLDVSLRIRFGQKFISMPDEKYSLGSKYPTLRIKYRKGLALLNSDIDYDMLALNVTDNFFVGSLGQSQYEVEGGYFLNTNKMYLMDYQHFLGNQTIFSRNGFGGFQLLDYYLYSTKNYYISGFYEHHFNGFFLNGIPLLKKLKWQEVISVNYLYTENSKSYLELGIGIEHIFKILRVDYFFSFQENKDINSGLRFGFGF